MQSVAKSEILPIFILAPMDDWAGVKWRWQMMASARSRWHEGRAGVRSRRRMDDNWPGLFAYEKTLSPCCY